MTGPRVDTSTFQSPRQLMNESTAWLFPVIDQLMAFRTLAVHEELQTLYAFF
jgi:hypothetical protein